MQTTETSKTRLNTILFLLLAFSLSGCGFMRNFVSSSPAVSETPAPGITEESSEDENESPPPTDSDGDGLDDFKEIELGTNPNNTDSDDDGLEDGAEVNTHGTDPLDPDTDDGGINDGLEVDRGGNPLDSSDDIVEGIGDADNDGLKDQEETSLGTNPNKYDSDNDGLSDGAEVHTFSTDPLDPDTDNGGVDDGTEVSLGTNPLDTSDDRFSVSDSDNDGLTDAKEVELGTNPNKTDSDNDGLSDGLEVNSIGSNPLSSDTDNGGISDGTEVSIGTNPLDPTDDLNLPLDSDSDGLTDVQELAIGSDPNNSDSDEDGLTDGAEFLTYKTDPTNADTDDGGVSDGIEISLGTDPLNGNDDQLPVAVALTFLETPSIKTTETSGQFVFTVDDASQVAGLYCGIDALNDDDLQACQANTPFTFNDLSLGPHTFTIKAISTTMVESRVSFVWEIVAPTNTDSCLGNDVQNQKVTVQFTPTTQACLFGQGNNLSPKNAYIQAVHTQSVDLNIPENSKLCSVEINLPSQTFYSDDHFALTWNHLALASNNDVLLSVREDGQKVFDFLKVRGRAAGFTGERDFCFGQSMGSTCELPAHDQVGNFSLDLSQEALGQLQSLIAEESSHSLKMHVTGDNNDSDCQHAGLSFEVDVGYVNE